MADSFNLPPAPSGSRITLNVPAEVVPYVDQYVAAVAREGESAAATVLRKLVEDAMRHRKMSLTVAIRTEKSDEQHNETEQLELDHQAAIVAAGF